MKFINFFLCLWVIFALRIRIANPAWTLGDPENFIPMLLLIFITGTYVLRMGAVFASNKYNYTLNFKSFKI